MKSATIAMNLSSETPEENWTGFQNVVHSSAATTLGHQSLKHQDWFDEIDEEIESLLEEKLALYPKRQPTAIFVGQSRTGSETCNTPDLARKQKKPSLL